MDLSHGQTADGKKVPIKVADDGTVATSATVEPPVGGATEAKQNATLAALAAGVPVTGPAAATLALDATIGTLITALNALSAKLPSAALATGTLVTPTTTQVIALMAGYSSGLTRPLLWPVNSAGVPSMFSNPIAPAGRSASLTALQVQRSVAFGCTPRTVIVWSKYAGEIAFFNSASAVANGAVPYGGRSYPIGAGEHLAVTFSFAEPFGTGFTVCHCTSLDDGAGNGTVTISTTASCRYTILYD